MIIWIIIAIIALIAGAYVIAFSGDSEDTEEEEPPIPNDDEDTGGETDDSDDPDEPDDPDESEPLPTASLAVTGNWVEPPPNFPASIENRFLRSWRQSTPQYATFTPTFTGGTAVLSMNIQQVYGTMSPTVTPTPGTVPLTPGTPITFTIQGHPGEASVILTFTLTVTSPSGQIATTSESIGVYWYVF